MSHQTARSLKSSTLSERVRAPFSLSLDVQRANSEAAGPSTLTPRTARTMVNGMIALDLQRGHKPEPSYFSDDVCHHQTHSSSRVTADQSLATSSVSSSPQSTPIIQTGLFSRVTYSPTAPTFLAREGIFKFGTDKTASGSDSTKKNNRKTSIFGGILLDPTSNYNSTDREGYRTSSRPEVIDTTSGMFASE
ncbi:hypothetical protein TREMEDRAFT_60124 [Tremella mesenterica DSM 1558]|uniref:uncharacterized protein n=1 Tax=Tremella mesenterica (strain ATCC 24925 / CBS 8224 / DSM 1558 / NBRC 9311 / NRRL Y-6157 / RJB 2259-6 / UBC 559-6) TaxID=578456 RepID=UPI0003F4A1BF|nr:uncharacterized protein TREMEDRAFT_60124 [Tremella mesenterica DSM 1558]EIW71192.1 hypothetical protein TREMEDRAFT_60124 [Tremella mesenterica DSM 1558]